MKIRCSCFNMEIERIVQQPPLLLQNIIKLHFIVPSAIHPSSSTFHLLAGKEVLIIIIWASFLLRSPPYLFARPMNPPINSFMNHGVLCVLYAAPSSSPSTTGKCNFAAINQKSYFINFVVALCILPRFAIIYHQQAQPRTRLASSYLRPIPDDDDDGVHLMLVCEYL